jgi:hypothetical protein
MARDDAEAVSSWPEPARFVLRRAIERHGGWERWRRVDTVSFVLRTMPSTANSTTCASRFATTHEPDREKRSERVRRCHYPKFNRERGFPLA